jgi:hypothetical protein
MFRCEDGKQYRMPAHFGGVDFDPDAKAYYHDVITLAFSYATDGKRLADFLPEGLELLKPELHISYQQCRQVEWMAGSFYNLVTVAAPVRYNGRRDRLEGTYALVVWENKTTPILTGNMMGVPKIYADIEDLHIIADAYRTRLSYEGSTFLQLEMTGRASMTPSQVQALHTDINSIGWRYIPKVGAPGAALSQLILFPMRSEPAAAWVGSGSLQWTTLTWDQNPMQWQIIEALAALPMNAPASVVMMQGRTILMEARGRVLS